MSRFRLACGPGLGLTSECSTHHYYYLSRFMFAFYLMAIIFAAIALFTGLLAMCSRLGGYISGFNTSLALFFQTIAAALMT